MPNDLEQFFNLLFDRKGYLPFIEIRAIAPDWYNAERKVFRYFAPTVDAALVKVDEWKSMSPYNLFFGVLPRYIKGSTKEAIIRAATLWVDIDVKDVGSKNEAKHLVSRASGFLQSNPTIVVDSANGLHGYWLLEDISEDLCSVESSNQYIASLSGGDHTHDVSRILRIPNTLNWKEKDSPKICQILSLAPENTLSKLPSISIPKDRPFKTAQASATIQKGFCPRDYSLDRLSPLWRRYVQEGTNADMFGYYRKSNGEPDKSRLDFAVVQELLKNGYSDDEVYSILTNPVFGISEKTLSKPNNAAESYVSVTIENAKKRLCLF